MFKTISLSKLNLSETNVRKNKTDRDIEQLANDILAHGLINNLLVTPTKGKRGQFDVTAGGRRLRAMRLLVERGEFTADHEVPCIVKEGSAGELTELSLSENFQRDDMTPVDEFRAFKTMSDEGISSEDIARRFGVTVRFVEGRMRLAMLHPDILAALDADTITLDMAKAYASTANQDRQISVFQRFTNCSWATAQSIRREIQDASMDANGALATFVTEEAYLAAGGIIERDLFSNDDGAKWLNSEIAETIAQAKLETEAERIRAETGVGRVIAIANHYYHNTTSELFRVTVPNRALTSEEASEAATLREQISLNEINLEENEDLDETAYQALSDETDDLTERLRNLENQPIELSPEIRAKLILVLYLTREGTMEYSNQYYSDEPIRLIPTNSGNCEVGDANTHQARTASTIEKTITPEAAAPDGSQLSQRLFDRLAIERRDILSATLLTDPALALDYMIFTLASSYNDTGLAIRASGPEDPNVGELATTPAKQAMAEAYELLDHSWAQHENDCARFAAFSALDDEHKAGWIAYIASKNLRAKQHYSSGINPLQNDIANRLGIKTHEIWRPTADNYFLSIKKPAMLKLLDQFGGAELSARYANAKKSELADVLEKICAGTALVEAEVKERALAWVPNIMTFSNKSDEPDTADDGDLDALISADAFPEAEDENANQVADESVTA